MGSLFKKPKTPGPSKEEQELVALRKQEQQRAEQERLKQIQEGLREETAFTSKKTGRRSLLTRGNSGFQTVGLRSLLGGS